MTSKRDEFEARKKQYKLIGEPSIESLREQRKNLESRTPGKKLKRSEVKINLEGWTGPEFGFKAYNKKTGEEIADVTVQNASGIDIEEAWAFLEMVDLVEKER
jgi:hypothetical protein